MLKKLFIALLIALIAYLAYFFMTHKRVYGKCHQGDEGYTCSLIKYVKTK